MQAREGLHEPNIPANSLLSFTLHLSPRCAPRVSSIPSPFTRLQSPKQVYINNNTSSLCLPLSQLPPPPPPPPPLPPDLSHQTTATRSLSSDQIPSSCELSLIASYTSIPTPTALLATPAPSPLPLLRHDLTDPLPPDTRLSPAVLPLPPLRDAQSVPSMPLQQPHLCRC
jgi:hypothetical protein